MGTLVGIASRSASRAPMQELAVADVTRERGVAEDFRGKPGDRQVTVLSRDAWEKACAELGAELSWTLRRANLLVEGVSLEQTTGRRLRVGEALLEVTCETDPCRVMDAQHPGLRAALEPEWRGGASCRVIHGGAVRVGDDVEWDPDPERGF